MIFTVITYNPKRMGLLGAIPEQVTLSEVETDSLENLTQGLSVPLEGYCLIIDNNDITKVESKILNEVTKISSEVIEQVTPKI